LSSCGHRELRCKDICAGNYPFCWNNWEGQKSGAYIFRPNSSDFRYPGPSGKPSLRILEGDVVTEVHQIYSDWVSHVIRLVKGEPYIEVEWTVGPIPTSTPWITETDGDYGKEVAIRYETGLNSAGIFHTDSNGREMMKRRYNGRPDTYPVLEVSEPVAGNYYPVNAMASVDDGEVELAVLTDVTQGGASLQNGSLELMVHRRTLSDDARGVGEPLNETMCGCTGPKCWCAGLVMRGRHWLVLDTLERAHEMRRALSERQNFRPTLAFSPTKLSFRQPSFSALASELPANVKLMTLTNTYASANGGRLLLRLGHLYAIGEHPILSLPATVDLSALFGHGFQIVEAEEMSLTANQNRREMEKRKYNWRTEGCPEEDALIHPSNSSWEPMKDRLNMTLRPMEVKTLLVTLANTVVENLALV